MAAGAEVSYQHSLGTNFAEIDLGYNYATGTGVTAMYNFLCATPDWSSKGSWEVYAGPGISFGTYFDVLPFSVGVCGQVGLSYTFWFPLQISIDMRPTVAFGAYKNTFIYNTLGLMGFVPTLGVRYSFGKK